MNLELKGKVSAGRKNVQAWNGCHLGESHGRVSRDRRMSLIET
jgi:hypothetical protein